MFIISGLGTGSIEPRATKSTPKIIENIKTAFAQLDLLGFVPGLKAHTSNMIKPTSGMMVMISVSSQSPSEMGAYCVSSCIAIPFFKIDNCSKYL